MNPASGAYRIAILGLASFMIFGSYFAYDSVGAIEVSLIEALHADRSAIATMYSVYSFAAIAAVLVGGFLIDKIGTRRASLLFSAVLTAGAVVVAVAPSVGWIYVGRLLFGMGSEPLIVAQSAILARWFRGRELALSFGVALTVSRLGTLFTFNSEALIADRYGWRAALVVAAALCGASLLTNLLYNVLDKKAEPMLGLGESGGGDAIDWKQLRRGGFPPSFWYVTALCVTFYSAIFPFTALSTDFFHHKWGIPEASPEGLPFFQAVFFNITHMFTTAQGTTTIIITASMLLAPFAGRVVDRVGRRATFMIVGSLLMIPGPPRDGLDDVGAGGLDDRAGRRLRARPGGHVAVGAARRRERSRGHGVRTDDRGPERRPARFPVCQRQAARRDRRLRLEPDDVCRPGRRRARLRDPSAGGGPESRPRARESHAVGVATRETETAEASYSRAGSNTRNIAPPPLASSTQIVPPCASTARRQNVRPRPRLDPGTVLRSSSRWNLSKIRSRCLSGTPGPRSDTDSSIPSAQGLTATSTTSPLGECSIALASRLSMTLRSTAGSPVILSADASATISRRTPR
jgi:MFS family permease